MGRFMRWIRGGEGSRGCGSGLVVYFEGESIRRFVCLALCWEFVLPDQKQVIRKEWGLQGILCPYYVHLVASGIYTVECGNNDILAPDSLTT